MRYQYALCEVEKQTNWCYASFYNGNQSAPGKYSKLTARVNPISVKEPMLMASAILAGT